MFHPIAREWQGVGVEVDVEEHREATLATLMHYRHCTATVLC